MIGNTSGANAMMIEVNLGNDGSVGISEASFAVIAEWSAKHKKELTVGVRHVGDTSNDSPWVEFAGGPGVVGLFPPITSMGDAHFGFAESDEPRPMIVGKAE